MLGPQLVNGESFRDIIFRPMGQLGRRFLVLFNKTSEFILGVVFVFCREDVSDIVGDLFSQVNFRRVMDGVLCQVKLASLPRHACEGRLASRPEPLVRIAADQIHAVQSALFERTEELSPVHFGFGKRNTDAEHTAMAAGKDPDSD